LSFIVNNWILIFAAVTSGAMLLWPMIGKGGGTGAVSPADAVRLINKEKALLIDVCEPAEFAAGHAAGARNVPLGSLDGGKGLPTNKALPLVVMCATGARSSRAAAQLRKAGYGNVRPMAGGELGRLAHVDQHRLLAVDQAHRIGGRHGAAGGALVDHRPQQHRARDHGGEDQNPVVDDEAQGARRSVDEGADYRIVPTFHCPIDGPCTSSY